GFVSYDCDFINELDGVVGANFCTEAVLERSDDPPPVGIVLGVGACYHEHIQGQTQHVTSNLDIALFHYVQQRYLDTLGQIGQLIERNDTAICTWNETVWYSVRLTTPSSLCHPHWIYFAVQIGY